MTCVFRYCKNTAKNVRESSDVTFHRFVHPGHVNREKWIKIVQKERSEKTWLPSKYSCVCSAHFKAEDFYITVAGKRFLKKFAIPSQNISQYFTDINRGASPTSLDDVEVSDTESIFDTPQIITLKNDLRQASDAKIKLTKKVIKLQRQNKSLERKTQKLTAIVKQLKGKLKDCNSKLKQDPTQVDQQS